MKSQRNFNLSREQTLPQFGNIDTRADVEIRACIVDEKVEEFSDVPSLLRHKVFSHGQILIGLSRLTCRNNLATSNVRITPGVNWNRKLNQLL